MPALFLDGPVVSFNRNRHNRSGFTGISNKCNNVSVLRIWFGKCLYFSNA